MEEHQVGWIAAIIIGGIAGWRTRMHAARAQPGEMSLADQQPGRRRLLLLRERASQRTALLPGARAHRVSVGRSATQQRGCVSIRPQPRRRAP
jgi:hypothetical protein